MLSLQLLVNGLVTGCALGVVAISFSLVYATTKIFHVAHAGIYTMGGYLAWWLVTHGAPLAGRAAARGCGLHRRRRADPKPALRAAGAAAGDAPGDPDRLARHAGGDAEHHCGGVHAEHPAIPAAVGGQRRCAGRQRAADLGAAADHRGQPGGLCRRDVVRALHHPGQAHPRRGVEPVPGARSPGCSRSRVYVDRGGDRLGDRVRCPACWCRSILGCSPMAASRRC